MAKEPIKEKLMCGIVMPISALDGCAETHWSEVAEIISTAIETAGFEANLVSNAEDVGIIQKRIIQNLYDNPIVVCDVSGKNPNVMFELGIRLAFDKPTIIIKDDKTSYSFDTAPIEHLEYPRDLRFSKIVEFKTKLTEKIRATHTKATTDENYTTFLKHFGEFKVAKLEKKEVSGQEYILDELRGLRSAVRRLEYSPKSPISRFDRSDDQTGLDFCLKGRTPDDASRIMDMVGQLQGIKSVRVRELRKNHPHLYVTLAEQFDRNSMEKVIEDVISRYAPPSIISDPPGFS